MRRYHMHPRVITQKTKSGKTRKYIQLVESIRRPSDGMPAKKVVAHLGPYNPVLYENLQLAFSQARLNSKVTVSNVSDLASTLITCQNNLVYLPIAVIVHLLREQGISGCLRKLAPDKEYKARLDKVIEALVAQRCIAPSSKLAFQDWKTKTAIPEVIGTPLKNLNNSRIHRAMSELAEIENEFQHWLRNKITTDRTPQLIYLDLTDTWFDAGGGSLARRGQTKQGHRSKRKIHIAMLVDDQGLPLSWELLPGALNESTVLPAWIDFLNDKDTLKSSVLIFDRGMPSAENFAKLVDSVTGHLFLTSVKSDNIPFYVCLPEINLDYLQCISKSGSNSTIKKACQAAGLSHLKDFTYAMDLGLVNPPEPRSKRQKRPPEMRMYLYYNREIQQVKSNNRRKRIRDILKQASEMNMHLRNAKKQRCPEATRRKISRIIEKHKLSDLFQIKLKPIEIQGRTKKIHSFEIRLKILRNPYRIKKRYDGVSLLVGHPKLNLNLRQAVEAYRNKNMIEANFRTIKSVLNIQPTFHWTDKKIQSHVFICILGLLVERLVELKLKPFRSSKPDLPKTADALFGIFDSVQLNKMKVENKLTKTRTAASNEIVNLLKHLGCEQILKDFSDRILV